MFLVVLDFVFFTSTDATKVAPIILILGFVLLLLTIYEGFFLLFTIARLYGLPIKNKNRLSMYSSGVMGLIIALQSIGELTPKDVLVIMPIAIIGYIYNVYASSSRRKIDV